MDNPLINVVGNNLDLMQAAIKLGMQNHNQISGFEKCWLKVATHYPHAAHNHVYGVTPERDFIIDCSQNLDYVEVPEGTKDAVPTLILYWHNEDGISGLPSKMKNPVAISNMIQSWLDDLNWDYDNINDSDVGVTKAWRIFTGMDTWGHLLGSHYSVFAVQPYSFWHGK
jgi:hypothetical protein